MVHSFPFPLMSGSFRRGLALGAAAASLELFISGCQTTADYAQQTSPPPRVEPAGSESSASDEVKRVSNDVAEATNDVGSAVQADDADSALLVPTSPDSENAPEPVEWTPLPALVSTAEASNPNLMRLQREVNAAWARVRYQDQLPDPTVGANVFGHPIETAAGSQRANLTVMQMIPWLDRLDAQAQQACFEALALQQAYEAERLKVTGDLHATYYKLYVLQKQIETVQANQKLLEGLIEVVNARVVNARAGQGDVLLGTLEYSRQEEQLIMLRQQWLSAQAEINRLTNRPAETPVELPAELSPGAPGWSHGLLRDLAWERQPAIVAAHLRTNAARWGVEVAELRRRPDFSVGASWFFMDDNRPPSAVVDVGDDAWSANASLSIPLWREKYDAIHDEASWRHFASQAQVEDLKRQFDAQLLDLLQQALAADETATLYRDTIIPQARQTLRADQESLTNGTVEFDRVIQDFRNLLTLEFGYHRAVGQLATALARIRQAVGVDLAAASVEETSETPTPAPDRN